MARKRFSRKRRFSSRKKRFNRHRNIAIWRGKEIGQYAPDMMTVKLRYFEPTKANMNNVGFAFTNQRYRMNDAFDVNPALASTSMVGFVELSAIYASYRVIDFAWHVTFGNKEAFPITVFTVPLPQVSVDPGANATVGGTSFMMMPYAKSSMCGALTGNSIVHQRGHIGLTKLYGNKQVLYSDAFSSPTSGHPIDRLYFMIGAVAQGELFTAFNGVDCHIDLILTTQFFSRIDVAA